jgi:hypothetical protein
VTKTEVDSFDAGKRIPACQLQVVAQKSQRKHTHLIHPLKLLGTKTLHDYITLFRSPANIPGKMYACNTPDVFACNSAYSYLIKSRYWQLRTYRLYKILITGYCVALSKASALKFMKLTTFFIQLSIVYLQ